MFQIDQIFPCIFSHDFDPIFSLQTGFVNNNILDSTLQSLYSYNTNILFSTS